MAQFNEELPDKLIKDFLRLAIDSEKLLEEMTKAGAKVVEQNIKRTVPVKELARYVKVSRSYKTPSDGGINTQVYINGYMPFKGGRTSFTQKRGVSTRRGVPADFIAKLYEYGRSTSPFPKRPFMRKAFKKNEIETAMLRVQDEYIKKVKG